MGRITFPQFPPNDSSKLKAIKGHILPLHQPVHLPEKSQTTPMSGWNPGIPVPSNDVTHAERDLFRAKSITLVRNSPLDYPVEKWIQFIQNTPIVQIVREGDSDGTVTLQQMLPIHQGVLVEVSFQRKGKERCISIPLQESFRLSQSPYKAHPLPRQHTGWALSEELFTPSEELATEKTHFITQLAQHSFLAEKNEQLLFQKHNAFQQMPKRLLECHHLLAHALESASQFPSPSGVIDNYFASLNEKEGWSHLTHLYEAVNALLHKKIDRQEMLSPPLGLAFTPTASASSVLAVSTLQQLQSKHPAERYTRWIVQVLRQGADNPDTRFGKQLQEIYAFQLTHFLQEQRESIGTPAEIAKQMLEALEKEIAILTKRTI